MVHWRKRLVSALLVLGFLPFLHSQPRTLHYRFLSIDARLDSEGILHVLERQEMVFSGDWNGGERTFRVEFGQHLEFNGISRLVAGKWQSLTVQAA